MLVQLLVMCNQAAAADTQFKVASTVIVKINNTGQQRFCPVRKISVSDVVLDAEFKYVSRIFLSLTTFAPC
jgi:hypothetical protein